MFSGLVDYGPLGTGLMDNLLAEWERRFIIQADAYKIASPFIMPEAILKASGHVDKFADYKVKVRPVDKFADYKVKVRPCGQVCRL